MERRQFLRLSGAGAAVALAGSGGCASPFAEDHESVRTRLERATSDEQYWDVVRSAYLRPEGYVDLDHANTAPTPEPVLDAYVHNVRRLSRAPAEEFDRMWREELEEKCRAPLAAFLGTQPKHLAFVANTTSALNTVLHGISLTTGDEILVTDHEYPDMVETVLQRVDRDGVAMRRVRVPGPMEDASELAARVRDAITDRTRLLLISHVSAWNGEVLPVAEVAAVARSRGVPVLLDAAQSVGIIDVNFEALGCDFMGASMHKGLAAPLPTGVLVMRPELVQQVRPLHPPSWSTDEYPMDRFEWSGTFNMAALATISDALAFHEMVGPERKSARLRELSGYWQDALRDEPSVRRLTPQQRGRSCGPAAFALEGIPSGTLAKHLREVRGVLVQSKAGRHSPYDNAIRVSPGAHATFEDLDVLVNALRAVARSGLS
jgi:isopenicillin-N epimerase